MDDLLPNFRLHLAIGLVLLAGTLAVLLLPGDGTSAPAGEPSLSAAPASAAAPAAVFVGE